MNSTDNDPELRAAEDAAEAERFAQEIEDGPEQPAWQVVGQTCGNRALTLTRDADNGYVAEATLTHLEDGVLFSFDEPSIDEIRLMRESLYFEELISLWRKFAYEYPGFVAGHTDLAKIQQIVRDFDEVWP